jgi:benzoate-CoA ligase family protein
MTFKPPEEFNLADWILEERLREGRGGAVALRTDRGETTYDELSAVAAGWGRTLRDAGVQPEQRVLLALPDGVEWVGAFFGALKIGAVVVMVNPDLPADALSYFLEYTRAKVAVTDAAHAVELRRAAEGARHLGGLLVVGEDDLAARIEAGAASPLETFPSHRDDPAIWLFSGGTTGKPKAVVQPHASFANTTELYAKGVLGYRPDDVTLSVPKLFFGYATGSNLLFPLSVGASAALFPERCTPETLFEKIERFRPTILVNVPTMIQRLVTHPTAAGRDLGSLRIVTSAGEALSSELHERWRRVFGGELLDGLGTAEMWHVFLTNRPGESRPGTLGRAVPGFDVEVRDDDGVPVPDGEVGWLWVRGGSRALGYWQRRERSEAAFRGEWYVSGDMVRRDADGFFTYCGRGDDMLKVAGKWLAPKEVEECLLAHAAVKEVAVVGVPDANGLVKPWAFVIPEATGEGAGLAGPAEAPGRPESLVEELRAFARERMEAYKHPREVVVVDDLPRTHLGKVDRGALRREAEARR